MGLPLEFQYVPGQDQTKEVQTHKVAMYPHYNKLVLLDCKNTWQNKVQSTEETST